MAMERREVVALLMRTGLPDLADEANAELPDPVEMDDLALLQLRQGFRPRCAGPKPVVCDFRADGPGGAAWPGSCWLGLCWSGFRLATLATTPHSAGGTRFHLTAGYPGNRRRA